VEVTVPYITFQNGTVYSANTNPDVSKDMEFIFTEDKTATLLFKTNTSGSRKILALNGDYRIKKGGKRIEPVLATQSGSFNSIGKVYNNFRILLAYDILWRRYRNRRI